MNDPTPDSFQQFLRIAAQFVGGVLVTKGFLDESGLVAFTGVVMSAGAFGWWFFWNRKRVS